VLPSINVVDDDDYDDDDDDLLLLRRQIKANPVESIKQNSRRKIKEIIRSEYHRYGISRIYQDN